jgi:hypothetical protein
LRANGRKAEEEQNEGYRRSRHRARDRT